MSVDEVNFTIREPRPEHPGSHWYDHKSHHMKWQLMFNVVEFYGLMDLGQVRSVVMVL